MEEVATARSASVIERQNITLDRIKANVAAKKRREDLAVLLVDIKGMDDEVRARCVDQRTMIMSERRAPPATQASTTTQPATSTPTVIETPLATEASPTITNLP
jgi:uncharacterized protein (DUF2235 family)